MCMGYSLIERNMWAFCCWYTWHYSSVSGLLKCPLYNNDALRSGHSNLAPGRVTRLSECAPLTRERLFLTWFIIHDSWPRGRVNPTVFVGKIQTGCHLCSVGKRGRVSGEGGDYIFPTIIRLEKMKKKKAWHRLIKTRPISFSTSDGSGVPHGWRNQSVFWDQLNNRQMSLQGSEWVVFWQSAKTCKYISKRGRGTGRE